MTIEYKVFKQDEGDSFSPGARRFYEEHGYVILATSYPQDEMSSLRKSLHHLQERYAKEMGMNQHQYEANINQWRDLWEQESAFAELLQNPLQHQTARFFMQQQGVQLLHDHVISKPCTNKDVALGSATNAVLPWHQDFPFWPVNTPDSLSIWMPLEDVSANGGCMQVIDGSHKWGASRPVDFIMDDPDRFAQKEDCNIVTLPAQSGMIIVLHSLTWHRSLTNCDVGTSRPVYISLWVPASARYSPDDEQWHPLNERISVDPGEVLNTDSFPLFGERTAIDVKVQWVGNNTPPTSDQMDMFGASRHVAQHICQQLGRPYAPLIDLLSLKEDRESICVSFMAKNLIKAHEKQKLLELLASLYISAKAYDQHKARNVFNDAYANWWQWLGKKITRPENAP